MSIFPSTQGVPQTSDICSQEATNLVGSAAREDFKSVFTKAETKLGYAFQDSEILVTGGGDVTFDGTNLTWASDIHFFFKKVSTSATESMVDLTVAASNIAIANDNAITFELFRSSSNTITFSTAAISAMDTIKSSNIQKKIFAIRTGDVVYLRTGQSLQIGQTVKLGASGSGSGQGELNYIANPSAETNISGWVCTDNTNFLFERTTTAAYLPREFLTGTAFELVRVSADPTGQYVYYDFTLDDVDLNRLLKIQFDVHIMNSYAAGALAVRITTQADRTTSIATLSVSDIPAQDGTFAATFVSGSTATLSLVIYRKATLASAAGITFSNVIVGPGSLIQGYPGNDWATYTPTVTGSVVNPTTVTSNMSWRRDGKDLLIQGYFTVVTKGSASGVVRMTIPSGISTTSDDYRINLGTWNTYDDIEYGYATYQDGIDSTLQFLKQGSSGNALTYADIDDSDDVAVNIRIPIDAWSSNIYLGSGADTSVSPLNWTTASTMSTSQDAKFSSRLYSYRRVGDNLEVRFALTVGAAGGDIGQVTLTLPSSLQIDTAKLPNPSYEVLVGHFVHRNTGGSTHGMVSYYTASTVSLAWRDNAGAAGTPYANMTSANNDRIEGTFSVPIVGWTSQDYIGKMLVGFSSASATVPGLVNTDTQTLAGAKTFSTSISTPLIDNGYIRNIGTTSQEYIISGEYSSTIADGATDVSIFRVRPSEACAFTVYMDFIVTHAAGSGSSAVAAKSFSVRWGAVRDSAGNYALLATTNLDASAEYGDATATRGIGTVTFAAVYVSATDFRFRIATIDLTGSAVDVARVAGIARVINTGAALTSAGWQ